MACAAGSAALRASSPQPPPPPPDATPPNLPPTATAAPSDGGRWLTLLELPAMARGGGAVEGDIATLVANYANEKLQATFLESSFVRPNLSAFAEGLAPSARGGAQLLLYDSARAARAEHPTHGALPLPRGTAPRRRPVAAAGQQELQAEELLRGLREAQSWSRCGPRAASRCATSARHLLAAELLLPAAARSGGARAAPRQVPPPAISPPACPPSAAAARDAPSTAPRHPRLNR